MRIACSQLGIASQNSDEGQVTENRTRKSMKALFQKYLDYIKGLPTDEQKKFTIEDKQNYNPVDMPLTDYLQQQIDRFIEMSVTCLAEPREAIPRGTYN